MTSADWIAIGILSVLIGSGIYIWGWGFIAGFIAGFIIGTMICLIFKDKIAQAETTVRVMLMFLRR